MTPFRIVLPLRLRIVSELNQRGHWAKHSARKAEHRGMCRMHLSQALALRARLFESVMPCSVTLTRIAPRELDTDNLAGAFKACRDGIADALGVKDNDPRVAWVYEQTKGEPREYAIRIVVSSC